MQVFLQIVAFSLQTDGSSRLVLTKGKRALGQRDYKKKTTEGNP